MVYDGFTSASTVVVKDKLAEGTMRGSVKWFNQVRGYGFITRDDGGPDTFVHLSDVIEGRFLSPGDRVEFQVAQDQRGRPKAIQVRSLGKAISREVATKPERQTTIKAKFSQAQAVLSETKADLEALTELLIEKGIITRKEVEDKREQIRVEEFNVD